MPTNLISSLLAAILLVSATDACAQSQMRLDAPHGWSIGGNVGMSDFWGNVGTKSFIDHYNNSNYAKNVHGMGGLFARYSMSPAFSLKLAVNYGELYATDQWNYNSYKSASSTNSDAYQRYARFQDIKDNIWEGSMSLEWTPRRMNLQSKGAQRSAQPYLHLGVGYFHYQPYSSLNGDWVKIHDLHLEGDGFPVAGMPAAYKLSGFCIPVGVGYRFDIGEHLNLGVEYSYRFTFIGYMDDVSNKYIDPKYFNEYLTPSQAAEATALADKSKLAVGPAGGNAPGTQRGDPSLKDSYSTISIVLYFKVRPHGVEWWGE